MKPNRDWQTTRNRDERAIVGIVDGRLSMSDCYGRCCRLSSLTHCRSLSNFLCHVRHALYCVSACINVSTWSLLLFFCFAESLVHCCVRAVVGAYRCLLSYPTVPLITILTQASFCSVCSCSESSWPSRSDELPLSTKPDSRQPFIFSHNTI
jgi:hypothetical protein